MPHALPASDAPSRARAAAAVFLVALGVYWACPIATTFDSKWQIPTAISLLREGNLDLDEYASDPRLDRAVRAGGHVYDVYPVGPALVALPFVAATDLVFRAALLLPAFDGAVARSWRRRFDETGTVDLEGWNTLQRLIASVIVAAAAALFCLVGATFLPPERAVGAALLLALGTSALSTASRALWQHGPSILCLTLALLALLRARAGPRSSARWFGLAGFAVALAYVMRPTNALSVAAFTILVALTAPRRLPIYLAGAALVAAPWLALNVRLFGGLLPPYYRPGATAWSGGRPMLAGLVGTMLSPSRGLLVYTPVLAFVPAGVAAKLRARTFDALDGALLAVVALHWLVISSFPVWWGGHSFGPRLFCDMLPDLVYFLLPVIGALRWTSRAGRATTAVFCFAAAAGVAIHVAGATSWPSYAWNSEPADVNREPARLWDWRDSQLARGFLRR